MGGDVKVKEIDKVPEVKDGNRKQIRARQCRKIRWRGREETGSRKTECGKTTEEGIR